MQSMVLNFSPVSNQSTAVPRPLLETAQTPSADAFAELLGMLTGRAPKEGETPVAGRDLEESPSQDDTAHLLGGLLQGTSPWLASLWSAPPPAGTESAHNREQLTMPSADGPAAPTLPSALTTEAAPGDPPVGQPTVLTPDDRWSALLSEGEPAFATTPSREKGQPVSRAAERPALCDFQGALSERAQAVQSSPNRLSARATVSKDGSAVKLSADLKTSQELVQPSGGAPPRSSLHEQQPLLGDGALSLTSADQPASPATWTSNRLAITLRGAVSDGELTAFQEPQPAEFAAAAAVASPEAGGGEGFSLAEAVFLETERPARAQPVNQLSPASGRPLTLPLGSGFRGSLPAGAEPTAQTAVVFQRMVRALVSAGRMPTVQQTESAGSDRAQPVAQLPLPKSPQPLSAMTNGAPEAVRATTEHSPLVWQHPNGAVDQMQLKSQPEPEAGEVTDGAAASGSLPALPRSIAPTATLQLTADPAAAPREQLQAALASGVKQVRLLPREQGEVEVKLHLYPEDLGEVRVNVRISEGTLSAKFQAASEEGARLIKESLANLRSTLNEQGFSQVSLAAESFAGNLAEQPDRRSRRSFLRSERSQEQVVGVVPENEQPSARPVTAKGRLDYRF